MIGDLAFLFVRLRDVNQPFLTVLAVYIKYIKRNKIKYNFLYGALHAEMEERRS